MEEVDINRLTDINGILKSDLPDDIIIIGKIFILNISDEYDQLDLSRLKCRDINYYNQIGDSIKNHILPNSLKELYCSSNSLTSLPDLPNSLEKLYCSYNQLTSLPDHLPDSLKTFQCSNNDFTIFPKLPNSLTYLDCSDNPLMYFNNIQFPNSLTYLNCYKNELKSLPDFSHIDHELKLCINQEIVLKYIPYNPNLKLIKYYPTSKIYIEGYDHNPIINQVRLDKYMDYKFHKMNRIKSARK